MDNESNSDDFELDDNNQHYLRYNDSNYNPIPRLEADSVVVRPLQLIVDLTEDASDDDGPAQNAMVNDNNDDNDGDNEDDDDDDIQIIEADDSNYNHSNNHNYHAIQLDLTGSPPPMAIPPPPEIYNNLDIMGRNNLEEDKQNDKEGSDSSIIVTSVQQLTNDEERAKKNRRLKKIEQWIREDDADEYLVTKIRQLLFNCPICHESLMDKNAMSTMCGHVFCEECLLSALNRVQQCPICQRAMSSTNTHKIYL